MKPNIEQLISQLTLEEKAGLCSGQDFWRLKSIDRLEIPSIMVADGPHGLRKEPDAADYLVAGQSLPATCFPSAVTLACSWDRGLISRMGEALGKECQAEGVSVLLGPGANIKRSPLCGRNFEYFSEDPLLSSEMAASHIRGVQSQEVGTSLKHFALNNQEYRKMTTDTVADERTLREIYLASFEGAVTQGKPWTVMTSYNRVNGEYSSENAYLLTEVLRKDWGFEGVVVSDWGAVNKRVPSLAAGLDLEMPFNIGEGDRQIIEAVKNGEIAEEVLDRAVASLLTLAFKGHGGKRKQTSFNTMEHHLLASEVARESMVLLKNEGNLLPIAKESNIAILGGFARSPRFQGGGSSNIVPTRLDNILDCIGAKVGEAGRLKYAQGYLLDSDGGSEELLAEAKAAAQAAEIAIIFAGLPNRYETEGYDRTHLGLPDNHIALIEAVSAVQPNVIVVLSNGSPVEMPWLPKVKSVLEAYLGGQAQGSAIADLLFGDANPCGKLAETFPVQLSDNPSYLFFPGENDRVEYREGLFVGYRYYDSKKVEPLFPFGHGLSYTSFRYSGLQVNKRKLVDNETVTVTVDITNTGQRAGKEIVQLYVRDMEASVARPLQELRGFEKIYLLPGEQKKVSFELGKRAFAYYAPERKDWHVESGEFEIRIGSSSRDLRLSTVVLLESTDRPLAAFTRNSTIGDLISKGTPDAETHKLIRDFMDRSGIFPPDKSPEIAEADMNFLPLRALVSLSKGGLRELDMELLLQKISICAD